MPDKLCVHLKKSFLKKNMCLAETSVRGKKWQMALFQVGSTINEMKRLFVVLAVISLTGSVAFAQKVHSDNQDIRFTAGVRIPIEHSRANSGEVMSLTYGKYNDKGFGFHGGVQWMFENMDINDYLGLPLSVSWSSGRRTFKQTLEDGLENTLRNAYHNKYYYNQNPTVDNVVGSFFTGLFNRIEFFAGLTPGYIFGPNDDSPRHGTYGGVKGESYMYIKNRFSLTADAGFGLSFNIWRFKLSVLPSVHYFITDNYREVNNKSHTTPTGTESDFTDQARSWQFSIQGGLSFSF